MNNQGSIIFLKLFSFYRKKKRGGKKDRELLILIC